MICRRSRGSGFPGQPVDRNPGAAERLPRGSRQEGWRLHATALAWSAAWEASRRVPEGLAFAAADWLGRLAFVAASETRRRLMRNLARVVAGEQLDATVREAFRSYARYWVEAFRAADYTAADLAARTEVVGLHHLDEMLDRGRGAIILLAHHGSWDVAAAWAESHEYHLAVVAEVLRPRRLFSRFVRLREAIGLEVVPLRRGQNLVARLEEVLAENHLVGLLAERDLSASGPVVSFFGEDMRLPRGPVVLAQRTGAPLLPVTMRQLPRRRWRLEVLPPLELSEYEFQEGAQRVTDALADLIRLDPAQWHAVQPVWLADLPPRRRGDWAPPGEQPA